MDWGLGGRGFSTDAVLLLLLTPLHSANACWGSFSGHKTQASSYPLAMMTWSKSDVMSTVAMEEGSMHHLYLVARAAS
eukprot:scaffold7751_cov76-Skeletonema_dohrnii-CCMP3373.AAC.2